MCTLPILRRFLCSHRSIGITALTPEMMAASQVAKHFDHTGNFIFPYNRQMTAGIHDAAQLQDILSHWTRLNTVRMWMWTAEWAAMMYYFGRRTYDAIQARMTSTQVATAKTTLV